MELLGQWETKIWTQDFNFFDFKNFFLVHSPSTSTTRIQEKRVRDYLMGHSPMVHTFFLRFHFD